MKRTVILCFISVITIAIQSCGSGDDSRGDASDNSQPGSTVSKTEADSIARSSFKTSAEDYDEFSIGFTRHAGRRFRAYRDTIVALSADMGPYATETDRETRDYLKDSAFVLLNHEIRKHFQEYGPVTLEADASVSYDADSRRVYFRFSKGFDVPCMEGERQVYGILKGRKYPHFYFQMMPMFKHETPTYLKPQGLSIPMDLDWAREHDIVGSPGVLEFTFLPTTHRITGWAGPKPPHMSDAKVEFPTIKLLSGRWIVGADTLWHCGEGWGTHHGEMRVPKDRSAQPVRGRAALQAGGTITIPFVFNEKY